MEKTTERPKKIEVGQRWKVTQDSEHHKADDTLTIISMDGPCRVKTDKCVTCEHGESYFDEGKYGHCVYIGAADMPAAKQVDWARWVPPHQLHTIGKPLEPIVGAVYAGHGGLYGMVWRAKTSVNQHGAFTAEVLSPGLQWPPGYVWQCGTSSLLAQCSVLVQKPGWVEPYPPESLFRFATKDIRDAVESLKKEAVKPTMLVKLKPCSNCGNKVAHARTNLCEGCIFASMQAKDDRRAMERVPVVGPPVMEHHRGPGVDRYVNKPELPQSHATAFGGVFDIRPLRHRFVEEARYRYPEVDEFDCLPDAP